MEPNSPGNVEHPISPTIRHKPSKKPDSIVDNLITEQREQQHHQRYREQKQIRVQQRR